jgi:hypothetical protein
MVKVNAAVGIFFRKHKTQPGIAVPLAYYESFIK